MNGGDFEEDIADLQICDQPVVISANESMLMSAQQQHAARQLNLKRHGQNSRIHEYHLDQVNQMITPAANNEPRNLSQRGNRESTMMAAAANVFESNNNNGDLDHINPPMFIENVPEQHWQIINEDIQCDNTNNRQGNSHLQEQYPPQYREFNNRSSMMQNRPGSAARRKSQEKNTSLNGPRSGAGTIQQLPPPILRQSLQGSPMTASG